MKMIFLDESGELGFKETSSNHFCITLLSCEDTDVKRLRGIPKKIRTRKLKKSLKKLPELKANNTNLNIRRAFLNQLKKHKIEIHTIILDKKQVYNSLRNNKHILYNYIANLIISQCHVPGNQTKLIVDRRGGKILSSQFSNYIQKKAKETSENSNIQIEHLDSKKDGGLQVVDFVSWAIFNKYEHKEEYFYNIIKKQIVVENKLWSLESQ
tara:strand:- start:1419 stop:2051 length:633 start_codon:yes stop_codon:yes gene_type:complete